MQFFPGVHRSFDCAGSSLCELATPLRMTKSMWRCAVLAQDDNIDFACRRLDEQSERKRQPTAAVRIRFWLASG